MTKTNNKKYDYDLEERTAGFGEEIIKFVKNIEKDIVNNILIS